MAHCDKVLNLRKDVSFDTKVVSAEWDQSTSEWHIQTNTGKQARARFLILATGLLHRTYKPNFPGLEGYKGILHHSAAWPEDISVKRKKVCVIGAGSTSVQIVQEVGKEAAELTIMMRRPSYCLPLRQRKMTEEEQKAWKGYYPALFKAGRNSAVGFPLERNPKRVQDATPEEREQYLESIWNGGGFHFMVRNYNNVTIDKEANKVSTLLDQNKVVCD
jgi:cation diffusion facilitator CzcD-associated flavoprotein CzcO